MKPVGHIATLIVAVAAVAAILGLSAGQLLKERRQVLEELGSAQAVTAESAAHDVASRLLALERDTRILANLVSRNRGPTGVDIATENRVIQEGRHRQSIPGRAHGADRARTRVGGCVRRHLRGGPRHLRALLEQARLSPSGRLDRSDVALTAPGANDFDVRIVSLRHSADEVRLLALIEDRSQLRSLERQVVRAEKILTVGVLSAGLAHEIGTPISVIRGRAEHLLELLAGSPAVEDLAAIVRHADRISSTIGQVLDFSRAQPIQVGPVEPADALEQARQLLSWKLESKRVSLHIAVTPGSTLLSADADQLQQVLLNLIMNACDACAEGGNIRAHMTPTASGEPVRQVRIDIHDDGCGIPLQNLNAG